MIALPHLRFLATLTTTLLAGLALVAVTPAGAGQWTGYVTTSEPPQLIPFNTADEATGTPIALANPPRDVAVAPDGRTIYVLAGSPNRLIPINSANGSQGEPILLDGPCSLLAITPDGKAAYAAIVNSGHVYRIDLATGAVSPPIAVGHQVWGIAIHPDGKSAYVTTGSMGGVSRIDLADRTVTRVGNSGASMKGIAFKPDGLFGYAISPGLNSVFPIDVGGGPQLRPSFGAGYQASEIAITPDGEKAFVVNFSLNQITVLDLLTGKTGSAIPVGSTPSDLALSPDGKTVFVANRDSGDVTPIDVATETPRPSFSVGAGTPQWIAVTPNQPPTARLETGPTWTDTPVRLDASSSVDDDGTIAQYEWDFGDGESVITTDPVVEHTYGEGTYTVSLTLTDDAGCSTEVIFTGQTATCNGSTAVARTALTLDVTDRPPTPPSPPSPPAPPHGGGQQDQDDRSGGRDDGDKPAGPKSRPATVRLAPIRVSPRRRTVRPGTQVRFALRVRNRGNRASGRLRICVRVPRRLVVPLRCRTVRSIRPGRTTTRRVSLRLRRGVRSGTRIVVTFRLDGRAAAPRKVRALLRVR